MCQCSCNTFQQLLLSFFFTLRTLQWNRFKNPPQRQLSVIFWVNMQCRESKKCFQNLLLLSTLSPVLGLMKEKKQSFIPLPWIWREAFFSFYVDTEKKTINLFEDKQIRLLRTFYYGPITKRIIKIKRWWKIITTCSVLFCTA